MRAAKMFRHLLAVFMLTYIFIDVFGMEVSASNAATNCQKYGPCHNDFDCNLQEFGVLFRRCSNGCCDYFILG
ncbi:hypothetical protein Btru_005133 [Bulinus truncatus]|nr:hypothetical protein Btru_005133 [Bulinus truncatus]